MNRIKGIPGQNGRLPGSRQSQLNGDPIVLFLRKKRIEKGLSLFAMELLCGVSDNTISSWENSENKQLGKIRKYAASLGYELCLRKIDGP